METYLVNTNEEKDSLSPQKAIDGSGEKGKKNDFLNVCIEKKVEENEEREGTEENEVIDNEDDEDDKEVVKEENILDDDTEDDKEMVKEENILDDDTEEDDPESNHEDLSKEILKPKTLSKLVSIMETTPDKKSAKGGKSKKPKANLAKVMRAKGKDQKTDIKTEKSSLTSSMSSMLEIVLKGLLLLDKQKGVSFPSIKKFVMKYEDQIWSKVRIRMRNALAIGLQENLILRPKSNKTVNGMQGSFKINKKEYNSRLAAKRKQPIPISKSKGPLPKTKNSTKLVSTPLKLDLSATSVWRILHRDLKLHPYKIQLTQELEASDHRQRRVFADWVLQQLEVEPNFSKKIIFSDEAHFWMNGYVNKQNCRIWDDANPHQIHQQEKVSVWCGFWSNGIIGPYFFENEPGIAINGERYRSMINTFLWSKLDDMPDMDTGDMWFQQDGATCHTAQDTIDILHQRFEGRVISRRGDVNWPPRSCDLTPLDFFLWGYLKSQVYLNNPQTVDVLKVNITNCIQQIQSGICDRVIENWVSRIRATKRSRGGHLNDVIFYT